MIAPKQSSPLAAPETAKVKVVTVLAKAFLSN
jgi:hypothetical protein